MAVTDKQQRIIDLARKQGVVRPRDLAPLGVSPEYLYHLVASGVFVKAGRGLYTLSGYDVTEHHTLVEAIRVQSNGVICLFSALSFHVLGTQQPYEVWLAVPYGARIAKNSSIPIHTVTMRSPSYDDGIENHVLEGVAVPVYSVAKTVADCFKFRNRVGLDVALEALREALHDKRCTREEIRKYAKVNRVENVMRPYMESMSA